MTSDIQLSKTSVNEKYIFFRIEATRREFCSDVVKRLKKKTIPENSG